jgi:hypothetical protein
MTFKVYFPQRVQIAIGKRVNSASRSLNKERQRLKYNRGRGRG